MFIRLCVVKTQLQTNCTWFKWKKALDADPRTIQQILFQKVIGGTDNTKISLYIILEKSKETVLKFRKVAAKSQLIV